MPAAQPIFDAHLDLAYLAACGRDMAAADPARAGGPDQPGCLTLPVLDAAPVAWCLGTIFTESGGDNPASYPPADAQAAHRAGAAQLEIYEQWRAQGRINLWRAGQDAPGAAAAKPQVAILMEGADPIRTPQELGWWADRGVSIIGLAWAHGSRYAGGNAQPHGLTAEGRDLIAAIEARGLTHDVSHLSDASSAELLEATQGPVIASHSNCRALLEAPGNQRHLTDAQIRSVIARGGIIGLNLYAPFLVPASRKGERATIDQACDHVLHICNLAGHAHCVGLGSDMDGGFSTHKLPVSLEGPAHLPRLLEALSTRGMTDADIERFASSNWRRFFSKLAASPS